MNCYTRVDSWAERVTPRLALALHREEGPLPLTPSNRRQTKELARREGPKLPDGESTSEVHVLMLTWFALIVLRYRMVIAGAGFLGMLGTAEGDPGHLPALLGLASAFSASSLTVLAVFRDRDYLDWFRRWPGLLADASLMAVFHVATAAVMTRGSFDEPMRDFLWTGFACSTALWTAAYGLPAGGAMVLAGLGVQAVAGMANGNSILQLNAPLVASRQGWLVAGVLVGHYVVKVATETMAEWASLYERTMRDLMQIRRGFHDEVLQDLRLAVTSSAQVSTADPALVGVFVRRAMSAAERLVRGGRSAAERRPFRERLEIAAQEMMAVRQVKIELPANVNLPLTPSEEEEVIRAVIEAMQNTRHADPCVVRVSVLPDGRVAVHDDGPGFNPSTVALGNGLRDIPERLREVGWNARLEAGTGSGTTWWFTKDAAAKENS